MVQSPDVVDKTAHTVNDDVLRHKRLTLSFDVLSTNCKVTRPTARCATFEAWKLNFEGAQNIPTRCDRQALNLAFLFFWTKIV